MTTVTVNTRDKSYPVHIGEGLLNRAGAIAAGSGIAAIVTDGNVDRLYADELQKSLKAAGFSAVKFVFPAGERSKNADTYFSLLNFLAENRLTRTDTVFALGGGVTGDLAGFAAATYLRGIRLIQLPTTLLSAVDSSVGGKTGVDLKAGKNLAGAFYQPDAVVCDILTLRTLPPAEKANGLAEVIKYAVLDDEELFSILKKNGHASEEIIARCVALKARLVERDERDEGERQLLNFGHTFGHAIEKCSGYSVPHGCAVAIGMAMMTAAAESLGVCEAGCFLEVREMLKRCQLPDRTEYGEEELFNALLSDKKRADGRLTLIVPEKIGRCVRRTVSLAAARNFLNRGLYWKEARDAD